MPALRYQFQTIEFQLIDIHVRTLRNRQEFLDVDEEAEKLGISPSLWPLFGVVWQSAEVLAHLMADYNIDALRILEVGCGIGLSSLLLNKRHADITATDYHPEAERFLAYNVDLNDDTAIPFALHNWDKLETKLGLFDLIIGSDILYERGHADTIAKFIDHHAKPHCEIIIVDPDRGYQGKFDVVMLDRGYTSDRTKPTTDGYFDKPYRGHVLSYSR